MDMRRIQLALVSLVMANLLWCQLPTASGAELTEQEFRQLHEQLQPGADELWRTIPWKTTLIEGQRIAAGENKLLFIWAMDGHPLGCT